MGMQGTRSLTYEQAQAIRQRYAGGELQQVLADEYGLSQGAISNLVTRRTYRQPEITSREDYRRVSASHTGPPWRIDDCIARIDARIADDEQRSRGFFE